MFKSSSASTNYEIPDEDSRLNSEPHDSRDSLDAKGPRDTYLRWIAVALASFLVFGNDYCYDLPQALQTNIQHTFQVNEVEYNLLYSVYSMPNIILPFFGGYILDYFGIRTGVILYNVLIMIGQGLFTFGCYSEDYRLLVLGRSVFGIGAECLNVAQSTIVTMWFKGKELSLALGISLCICRLGSSLNSFMSPMIFSKLQSLGHVSTVGLAFLTLSLVCGIALIVMDEKYLKGEKAEDTEKISFRDINKLKPNFWMLYVNGLLCFMSFFPFLNISNKYLQKRFNIEATVAGELLTIPYIVGGILTPILSSFIDRKGKKASLLILTCLILAYNHYSLATYAECDGCMTVVLPLILFGVFFGLYTSLLIPCVSIIADERVMGTAMGIIYSGQNTGLAIGPLIVGSLLNNEEQLEQLLGEYKMMSTVLGTCAFIAFLDAILNWWYDKRYNRGILQRGVLEMSNPPERKFEMGLGMPERKFEMELGMAIESESS